MLRTCNILRIILNTGTMYKQRVSTDIHIINMSIDEKTIPTASLQVFWDNHLSLNG